MLLSNINVKSADTILTVIYILDILWIGPSCLQQTFWYILNRIWII